MVWLDESGFMLQPVRRRTWAPSGQTPLHKCWARHDRLSVLGVLTCSPQRQRLGLTFELHTQNIRTPEVAGFLRHLQQRLRQPLILVLDRWSVHRAAIRQLLAGQPRWLVAVAWLPAYAPELNPVEQVWNHAKYSDLANYAPENLEDLHEAVGMALASMPFQPGLLRSFLQQTQLPL